MTGATQRIVQRARAPAAVFANAGLRRLQLGTAAIALGGWTNATALYVFAYDRGGASAVGLLGVALMLPAGVAAPFLASVADRFARARVLLAATLLRGALLVGTAAAIAFDLPLAGVYVIAATASVCGRVIEPTQSALVPTLASGPDELAAVNVVSSAINGLASFVGPAVASALLLVTAPGLVVLAAAAATLAAGYWLARLPRTAQPTEARVQIRLLDGFRAVVETGTSRLLVGLYTGVSLVAGMLNVVVVVTAFELLDLGESGVGILNSALGVGGVAGSFAALALVGRRRLATFFGAGVVLCGLPIAAVAGLAQPVAAIALFVVVGAASTVVDVAALTILQRAIPNDVLARVFGVLEGLAVAAIGLGSLVAPLLVDGLGVRGALIVTGSVLPLAAAIAWRRLAAIDERADPSEALESLRRVPFLAVLATPTLESLASRATSVSYPPGATIVGEGEHGDRFYVVAAGEVEVRIPGRPLRLGTGAYFGEIALLREVPRTAAVVAAGAVTVYALSGDDFVGAVSGHPRSAEVAGAVIGARLGAIRPSPASA